MSSGKSLGSGQVAAGSYGIGHDLDGRSRLALRVMGIFVLLGVVLMFVGLSTPAGASFLVALVAALTLVAQRFLLLARK